MKTATKRPNLPNDNLWQWAEQSRRSSYLNASRSSKRPCPAAKVMARGILGRFMEILRSSVKR